ncbi:MAG: YihY family inner membrane protein [Deltaproteobacteria bacterium]|nr:MAG: YihY family inner membrane protein [Deltaproteobacteria bacterium]
MSALHALIDRSRNFLEHELWEMDATDQPWWRRALINQGQILALVVRGFISDGCMLRASALTFTTLLSLVPLLALVFSVLKGFGVQNELEPLLLEQLAVGGGEAVTKIVEYINNTNVARLGTYGLVFLIATVLTLLSNIEESFNSVWGVKETRPMLRRFTDYFSVVTIGPLLVVVAISMTSTLKSQQLVITLTEYDYVGEVLLFTFEILPFVVMWLVFAGLYLFMPNVKVSPKAALVGGVFGGTLWQLSQWGYLSFQVGVARYNAIYGTMAALPILMIWIYLSWMIVLLGLEMTYATQNLRTIRQDFRGQRVNFASIEFIALTVLLFVSRRFYAGKPALGQEDLASQLDVPPRLLRTILEELTRLGFVVETTQEVDGSGYQPARALEKIRLYDVIRGLAVNGTDYSHLRQNRERGVVASLEETLQRAEREALAEMTLRDLVLKTEESRDQDAELDGAVSSG